MEIWGAPGEGVSGKKMGLNQIGFAGREQPLFSQVCVT